MADTTVYTSEAKVAQRAPMYIDVATDPRAKDQAYLNLYASRVGVPVIAVDSANGWIVGASATIIQNTSSDQSNDVSKKDPDAILTYPKIFGAILNPDPNDPAARPTVIVPTDPQNVTATWVGDDLQIEFDWDYTAPENIGISQFIVKLTADDITAFSPANTFKPDKTQNHQTLVVTKDINMQMFNIFNPRVTAVCVETADPLNNVSNTICAASAPQYVLNLPVPDIDGKVSAINNGYKVGYTTPTSSSFNAIDIWEIEANQIPTVTLDANNNPVGFTRVYFDKLNPAVITSINVNKRWIIARFSSGGGVYTSFTSPAIEVTPISPVSVDLTPPDDLSSVNASWSGDNIVITYDGVATDTVRFQAELTSPNNIVGYFYFFPEVGKSHTISSNDLFLQFGEHYNSFQGKLRSIDSADNRSGGISFIVPERSNPLSALTASQVTDYFTLTSSANSYVVNITLPSYAKYAHVYDKTTSWGLTDPIDETYLVASGSGALVVPVANTTDTHYVKIRFYDDFHYTSSYSNEKFVTPYDPGTLSLISNPIKIQTDGTIFAGDSSTSYPRVYFNKDGIFAYDAGQNKTTQIVNSALNGQPTFITTSAQIADWSISSSKIENTLSTRTNDYTGLSGSGTYAFWAGSSTSGGSSTSEFYVKPDGSVKANNITITGGSLQVGSGFSVAATTGKLTASGADITGKITADSGSITGNLTIGTSGSITSGITDQTSGNGGFILNKNGLRFDYGTTKSITTIDGTTGKLITQSANIGGWDINSTKIYKTSGAGNINLDSSTATIYASAPSVTTNTAGIGSSATDTGIVFWAGGAGPENSSNKFKVNLRGDLTATSATITGTIKSTGALGTVTLDGNNDKISFTGTQNAYIMPRNNNMFYTTVFGTDPFAGTDTGIAKTSTAWQTIFNAPMLSIGNLTNAYGNTFAGIGLYTGGMSPTGYIDAATYGGASKTAYSMELPTKPWLSLTTNGIQLGANQSIGIKVEPGDGYNPGITMYTAVVTDPTKGIMPDTTAAAIKIQNSGSGNTGGTVKIFGGSGGYGIFTSAGIGFYTSLTTGEVGDTAKPYIGMNSSGITVSASDNKTRIRSALAEYTGTQSAALDSAYLGASKITLTDITGVRLSGAPVTGDMNINASYGAYVGLSADYAKYQASFYPNGKSDPARGPGYANVTGMGPVPRSRAMIEDPVSGEMKLGFAVYYQDTLVDNATPSGTSGNVGDLWVQY